MPVDLTRLRCHVSALVSFSCAKMSSLVLFIMWETPVLRSNVAAAASSSDDTLSVDLLAGEHLYLKYKFYPCSV